MMKAIDILALVIGLVGAILNGILLWVIKANRSIDKKCSHIYKNIAIVDIINCIIIPSCFLIINGKGYNLDLNSVKNSIMYLVFGAMVAVPYLLLIFLSIVRVLILKQQTFYSQTLKLVHIKAACMLSWAIPLVGTLGIWIIILLEGSASVEKLTYIMKVQGLYMVILISVTLVLMAISVILMNNLLTTSQDSLLIPILSSVNSVDMAFERELRIARRTFCFFFLSILTFSSYPLIFSFSFFACGPYYKSKKAICEHIQGPQFSNPDETYAFTLVSLCGMSIMNSIVLLQQKSFFNTLLECWIFRIRWRPQEVENFQRNELPPKAINQQHEERARPSFSQRTKPFETAEDIVSIIEEQGS